MPRRTTARRVAWTGLTYVVLFITAGTIGPAQGLPGLRDSPQATANYLHSHTTTALQWAGVYLEVIGLLVLVAFVVALWRMLREADRDGFLPGLALAGGLIGATIKLASLPAAFAALYRAHDISPGLASALLDINSAAFVSTWATWALLLGAAGAVMLRTGALPHRHGYFAVAIALGLLASIPGFTSADPPTFMLTFVWIIAISVSLLRRADAKDMVHPRAVGAPTEVAPRAA
jgi:hypothetical protein